MIVISNQDEENNRRSSMGISSLVPIQYRNQRESSYPEKSLVFWFWTLVM
jgi:hypothetical protein